MCFHASRVKEFMRFMTAENGNLRENYLSITGRNKEKKDIRNYICVHCKLNLVVCNRKLSRINFVYL